MDYLRQMMTHLMHASYHTLKHYEELALEDEDEDEIAPFDGVAPSREATVAEIQEFVTSPTMRGGSYEDTAYVVPDWVVPDYYHAVVDAERLADGGARPGQWSDEMCESLQGYHEGQPTPLAHAICAKRMLGLRIITSQWGGRTVGRLLEREPNALKDIGLTAFQRQGLRYLQVRWDILASQLLWLEEPEMVLDFQMERQQAAHDGVLPVAAEEQLDKRRLGTCFEVSDFIDTYR